MKLAHEAESLHIMIECDGLVMDNETEAAASFRQYQEAYIHTNEDLERSRAKGPNHRERPEIIKLPW